MAGVLAHLKDGPEVDRTIYINLFPNKAKIPTNMSEIAARIKNLQFANKSQEDIKLRHRFNEVAALVEALETLPDGNPLRDHVAYKAIKARGYLRVPHIVAVTPPETPEEYADADFSPEAIQKRAGAGGEPNLKGARRAWVGHRKSLVKNLLQRGTVDHPLQSKDDVTRWCRALRGQPKYGVCNAVGDLTSSHA